MFNPSKISLWCLSFILSLFILCSCQKDNQAVDPVINYFLPSENQIFNVFDTILVNASVTSEEQLTGLMVGLVSENLVPVLETYPISINSNQIHGLDVHQHIPIDAIQLESGNYFIWIQATTARTTKNKYQKIRIIEVEKKIKKILLLHRSNVNTTSLFSLDSLFHPSHLYDFPQDLKGAAIDPLNSMLYLSGGNLAVLTAFNLDSNRVVWQKYGSGTPQLHHYQNIRLEGSMLLVSSSNGDLIGYDALGNISFYKYFGESQYTISNCIISNVLIAGVEQKNGAAQYVNNYYYPSGAYQSGIQVPFSVSSIQCITNDLVLVAGNQSGIGTLRYYYPKEPGLWTPCLFPGGTIKKMIPGSEGHYFIQDGNSVYWFQSASNTLVPFVSDNQNIVDVEYDVTTDHLVIARNHNIEVYSFPQASLIQSVQVPDSLKACLLWYNR
ncbi:MAG: hypothetical protein AB9842_11815 [Bacteroidales bacterium]